MAYLGDCTIRVSYNCKITINVWWLCITNLHYLVLHHTAQGIHIIPCHKSALCVLFECVSFSVTE